MLCVTGSVYSSDCVPYMTTIHYAHVYRPTVQEDGGDIVYKVRVCVCDCAVAYQPKSSYIYMPVIISGASNVGGETTIVTIESL